MYSIHVVFLFFIPHMHLYVSRFETGSVCKKMRGVNSSLAPRHQAQCTEGADTWQPLQIDVDWLLFYNKQSRLKYLS